MYVNFIVRVRKKPPINVEATEIVDLMQRENIEDYFMVGECVRFLFTSCQESQTNEWAQRTSEFVILHNKWIKIVENEQNMKQFVYYICTEILQNNVKIMLKSQHIYNKIGYYEGHALSCLQYLS